MSSTATSKSSFRASCTLRGRRPPRPRPRSRPRSEQLLQSFAHDRVIVGDQRRGSCGHRRGLNHRKTDLDARAESRGARHARLPTEQIGALAHTEQSVRFGFARRVGREAHAVVAQLSRRRCRRRPRRRRRLAMRARACDVGERLLHDTEHRGGVRDGQVEALGSAGRGRSGRNFAPEVV